MQGKHYKTAVDLLIKQQAERNASFTLTMNAMKKITKIKE